MNVATISSSAHVVDSFHEVLQELKTFDRVHHVGLTTDAWYGANAAARYEALGHESIALARPSMRREVWWRAEDINAEFVAALDPIRDQIRSLIVEHQPEVFLIADDQGPLEIILIEMFNRAGIPVVLLQHGYFLTPGRTVRTRIADLKRALVRARHRALQLFQRDTPPLLPIPKPFGMNGDCSVCAYSGLSAEMLLRSGVPASRVVNTGYPYFDRFARIREGFPPPPTDGRILVASSGQGKFGRTPEALRFYERVVRLTEALVDRCQITLRPKPGEDPDSFLPASLANKLIALPNLHVDRAGGSAIDSIRDHRLVIGETSSMLLEAAILGRPVLLLREPSESWHYVFRQQLWQQYLGALALDDDAESGSMIDSALSADYLERMNRRVARWEGYAFPSIDGRCASRVAHEVLRSLEGSKVA